MPAGPYPTLHGVDGLSYRPFSVFVWWTVGISSCWPPFLLSTQARARHLGGSLFLVCSGFSGKYKVWTFFGPSTQPVSIISFKSVSDVFKQISQWLVPTI